MQAKSERKHMGQMNQTEVSVKMRGERPGVEIKGLVAVCPNETVSFAPYLELWCKWRLQTFALERAKKAIVRKTRWLRTYDISHAGIVEIPLCVDEVASNGRPLPQQGCHVEITKIQILEDPRQWWTLGFEASVIWTLRPAIYAGPRSF